MFANEIKEQGQYETRISGKFAVVRVDQIRKVVSTFGQNRRSVTRYECTNLTTGRKVIIKSAARFYRINVQ